jgi:hypothetical protein
VTTPAPGNVPDPEPNPIDAVGSPIRRPDTAEQTGGVGPDMVVVVPVEVRAPVPEAVPVPATAAGPWSGTVIDPVPTTADDIAALALAVPDVVRLHAGRFGEVATYLPGRRVTGIKLGDDHIEVHVEVAGQQPVRETAQLIHAAVATLVATPVHVHIEDIAVA